MSTNYNFESLSTWRWTILCLWAISILIYMSRMEHTTSVRFTSIIDQTSTTAILKETATSWKINRALMYTITVEFDLFLSRSFPTNKNSIIMLRLYIQVCLLAIINLHCRHKNHMSWVLIGRKNLLQRYFYSSISTRCQVPTPYFIHTDLKRK
jgi:hypothetical protein